MRTFELMDYEFCRCTKDEIGQAWEPRWGRDDAAARRCETIQIGKRRLDIPWAHEDEEQSEEQSDEEIDMASTDVFERELAAYLRNPEQYAVKKAAQIPRLREEQRRRQQEAKEKELKKMDFASMSTHDLRVWLAERLLTLEPVKQKDEPTG